MRRQQSDVRTVAQKSLCLRNETFLDIVPQFLELMSSITPSWHLDIRQQPVRARMCGLGDKDRRQISPPPFVELLLRDPATSDTLDVDNIDISTFVLVTELWSVDETENLTLNQNITTVVDTPSDDNNDTMYKNSTGMSSSINTNNSNSNCTNNTNDTTSPTSSDTSLNDIPTRNLIGNSVLNPFKLFDEHGNRGIWFIVHDLSVRIEGTFKLKFLFVDLATDISVSAFSQEFKVYSAKRFPGVVDSSPLGKVFVSQGVKIPIRRENRGEGNHDE